MFSVICELTEGVKMSLENSGIIKSVFIFFDNLFIAATFMLA